MTKCPLHPRYEVTPFCPDCRTNKEFAATRCPNASTEECRYPACACHEPEHKAGPIQMLAEPRKHCHYFKPCPFDHVDIYRVLALFSVTDPCLQHAVKKLLVAGGRGGGKDITRDIQEAVDTLTRWQEMRAEEQGAGL